jgi:hypothetical protein
MKYLVCMVALLALTACDSEKVEIQKSPCVGLEGSPCGPKRPVNEQWLKEHHLEYLNQRDQA